MLISTSGRIPLCYSYPRIKILFLSWVLKSFIPLRGSHLVGTGVANPGRPSRTLTLLQLVSGGVPSLSLVPVWSLLTDSSFRHRLGVPTFLLYLSLLFTTRLDTDADSFM